VPYLQSKVAFYEGKFGCLFVCFLFFLYSQIAHILIIVGLMAEDLPLIVPKKVLDPSQTTVFCLTVSEIFNFHFPKINGKS
jgi:hypothetical protein